MSGFQSRIEGLGRYAVFCWTVAGVSPTRFGRFLNFCRALTIPLTRRRGLTVPIECGSASSGFRIQVGSYFDLQMVRDVVLNKQYELGLFSSVDLPRDPRTVVDLGGNIGSAALWFAARYPSAQVLSVEADPRNWSLLARNVKDYSRIDCVHAAMLDRDAEIEWRRSAQDWGHSLFAGEPTGQLIPMRRLSTILADFGITSVDVLKVDIEGAEYALLSDLEGCPPIQMLIVETHDELVDGEHDLCLLRPDYDWCTVQTAGDRLQIGLRRVTVVAT